MSLLAIARNKSFWLLDSLRGEGIGQAYEEIKMVDELDSSDPKIEVHRKKAWDILSKRACGETEHYKEFEGRPLECFPVINKNTIRNSQDSFISNQFQKGNLIQMATSGSTGTPFICYQNASKKKRVNAEIIYYSEKIGYKLGENLSYIRTIVKQNRKSRLKQFMQNQTLINCMTLDNHGIQSMLDELKKKSEHGKVTLLGYGSTYTAIKDYANRNHIEKMEGISVAGVISGSDMLFDETRQAMSRLFGNVPVVSRYSNEENGVIGQDEGMNNVFPINEADYIVEICDDAGKQVEEGNLGHIVVTDLYNYAMPMIRYDTGDVGAIRVFEMNGRRKRCICDFSGRSVDVIHDTRGNALSPYVITNYMWSYPDINQYQVIQTGTKNYTVKLNRPETFSRDEELRQMLCKLLGTDAIIKIEAVDGIPVLASGKRRYIINEVEGQSL